MLPTSSSSPSSFILSPLSLLLLSFVILFVSFPQLVSLFLAQTSRSSFLLIPSFLPHHPNPLPPTLYSPFPSTHQSLALASPLRTYGMMDRRASGASKAKGHLPGALHCRGALGPTLQPRPCTSVSRHSHSHSHNMHTATPIIG